MKRMLIKTAAIYAVLCVGATTYGEDYRTKDDAITTWGDRTHWEVRIGNNWVDATYYPGQVGSNPGAVTVWHATTVAVSDAKAAGLIANATLMINSGGTVTVTNDAYVNAAVTINSGGTMIVGIRIDVDNSASVTINGVDGIGTLEIQGREQILPSTIQAGGSIQINATNSSYYGQLLISANHTIAGDGKIQGNSDDALISIDAGGTLISSTNIEGHLQISGSGSFTNQDTVNANGSGTLKLAVTGTLDDTSSAEWKATATGAVLNFDSTIGTLNSLEGEFVIEDSVSAEIEVNHTLTTTGRLCMTDGILDVNENLTMGNAVNHMYATNGCINVATGKTYMHY